MIGASYLLALALLPTGCGGKNRGPDRPSPATEALVKQAEDHERQRRYDLARESYKSALEKAPDPASVAFAAHEFATALAFWGEIADAVSMLERAVAADPDRVAAWHDLGILRVKVGKVADAEVALRRARALAPSDPRPRIALAALLVKTRRYVEAESEYRQLLELELPERMRSAIDKALELLASTR